MKQHFCIVFVSALLFGLTACGKPAAPARPIDGQNQTGATASYSVYVPNANADGLDTETVSAEDLSAETVLAELKKQNVLPEAVSVNRFHLNDGAITIDFNRAFADAVCSMGTSGEFLVVGSVVNTFLDAFGGESVYFTVDDQILESGHETYDHSMTFFSFEQSAD